MGLKWQGDPTGSKECSTSGSVLVHRSGRSRREFPKPGTTDGGTEGNDDGPSEVPHRFGSLERPVGVSASEIRPPASPVAPEPPTGHSIDPDDGHAPPPVWHNVSFYRQRTEDLADLMLDMIEEGLDGMVYGTARQAAHYGRIANELYAMRARELMAQHPEWALAKEPPEWFFKGLTVALPPSLLLWGILGYAACMVLW